MTTINDIDDLVRVLDENPEWVEALRVRLLTRELLELPQVVPQLERVDNCSTVPGNRVPGYCEKSIRKCFP